MSDARLLLPEEVAARLRVSTRTIYRMARGGQLASLAVGSLLRFDPADIEAYETAIRRVGGPPLRNAGRYPTT